MAQPGNTSAPGPLRTYFATPVVVAQLAAAPELNRAIRDLALEREKTHPSTEHSNLGGYQSSWDFEDWGGEPARALLEAVTEIVDRMTVDRAGRPQTIAWRTNAWANINRSGHGNEFHTHPGAYWSACYYVDDGGVGGNPKLGGEFEIQDPRGVAPAMYAPQLAFAMPGGLSAGASELIRPQAGMVVVFPSWLSHGVRAYRGNGARISIAMNFSV